MGARVTGRLGEGRTMEITRPGKPPWRTVLPAELDQEGATPDLVDYVTAKYLVELPTESIRLGWETIYGLIRTTLMEADETPTDLAA
ncbi:hypothetical protein GCM10022409_17010 [Hymenobacter glaciei]|uniref:Uncharacterized protein n=2 Tax=Hymenobacter glaciei TaxID=877209 RepID=A0ABP7TZE6_9BACT